MRIPFLEVVYRAYTAASIHYSDWGGGGGAKVRKMHAQKIGAQKSRYMTIVYV